jgi:hypothetical protein
MGIKLSSITKRRRVRNRLDSIFRQSSQKSSDEISSKVTTPKVDETMNTRESIRYIAETVKEVKELLHIDKGEVDWEKGLKTIKKYWKVLMS